MLNWAIHTITTVPMGRDPDTKAYIARRIAEGKTKRDAMRCVKRCVAKHKHRTRQPAPPRAGTC